MAPSSHDRRMPEHLAELANLLPTPSPEEVRAARTRAGLTQDQAARLISAAAQQPYRTWQGYEAVKGRRIAMPPAVWELFLLKTGQHPVFTLTRSPAANSA